MFTVNRKTPAVCRGMYTHLINSLTHVKAFLDTVNATQAQESALIDHKLLPSKYAKMQIPTRPRCGRSIPPLTDNPLAGQCSGLRS